MYQRLFQITIVLFFVVVSIAAIAMIVTALLSTASPLLARDEGIVFVVGGLSEKRLAYMIVAASLLIAGFYLFFRRSRFRR